MMLDARLAYLIDRGAAWVAEARDTYRPRAIPVHEDLRKGLAGYFSAGLLGAARLKTVPAIPNPGFYAELAARGEPVPIDFSRMHGIAFCDTVVLADFAVRGARPAAFAELIFHELVHVAQYRRLGIPRFVALYVRGWAENGFAYERIPLEQDAYALQARFAAAPGIPFDVEAEVDRRLAAWQAC